MKSLQKDENDRSEEDISQLMKLTQVFFKDKGETEQLEITKALHFEYIPKDEVVFEYGTQGDKYYLVIRGELTVMLPAKKQAEISNVFENYAIESLKTPNSALQKGSSPY